MKTITIEAGLIFSNLETTFDDLLESQANHPNSILLKHFKALAEMTYNMCFLLFSYVLGILAKYSPVASIREHKYKAAETGKLDYLAHGIEMFLRCNSLRLR
jgi:hypothetical protein